MPNKEPFIKNECIVEIRYNPNSKLLDYRGKWAEAISQHMKLEHWNITNNRIEIFNEDKSTHIFLGYRNGGITISNVPNDKYFPNYINNLFSFIFALEGFGNPIFVERIGVRSKFCTPFPGPFKKLRNKYTNNYVNLTEHAYAVMGDAKLLDIGSPLRSFPRQTRKILILCVAQCQKNNILNFSQ